MDITKIKNFGYIPDKEDTRDALAGAFLVGLEIKGDIILPNASTPVHNQGMYPSCVGQSVARIVEYANDAEGMSVANSGRFIYAHAKQIDGIPKVQGTYFRTGLKVLREIGDAPVADWPEVAGVSYAKYITKPSASADKAAPPYRISGYFRLEDTNQMKEYLLTESIPFVMGAKVTMDTWSYHAVAKSPKYKNIPIIQVGSGKEYGHAMALVGICEKGYVIENSWGEEWGFRGRAIIPFDYPGTFGGGFYAVYDLPNDWQDINDNYKTDMEMLRKWLVGYYKFRGWKFDAEAWSAARQEALKADPEKEGFDFAKGSLEQAKTAMAEYLKTFQK